MHLCQTYSHRIRFSEKLSPEESMEIFEDTDSRVSVASNDGWTKLMPPMRKLIDPSIMTFASDLQSIADYFDTYYQSKLMTNAFTDSLFTIPREFPTNFDLLFDFYLRGTKPIATFFATKEDLSLLSVNLSETQYLTRSMSLRSLFITAMLTHSFWKFSR